MPINKETGFPVQMSEEAIARSREAAGNERPPSFESSRRGNTSSLSPEGPGPAEPTNVPLSPRGTPGSPTGPTVDPTEPPVETPTEVTAGSQETPSSTPVSQATRETLEQSKDAPLDTLGQRGLTQSVAKLQLGDDEIIADPTMFNVAPTTEPAVDMENLTKAEVPEVGDLPEEQRAQAERAVIAKDYELSLLSPEEMGQNLDRLRNEEPMQAADMTAEMSKLLDGMENGEIPLWAKPAVTKVEQQLAARGIGASSIGRDSLYNAIIQSAMPIAQQNASFKQDASRTNYNAKVQAIFSDVSAENAARQFNASSVNQKNQFMSSLQANLDSQTAARKDAISTFQLSLDSKRRSLLPSLTLLKLMLLLSSKIT